MSEPRDLLGWLLEQMACCSRLEPEQLSADRSFAAQGLTSVDAVTLTAALSEHLGREVSPTLFYDHPTPRELVAFLSAEQPDNAATASQSMAADTTTFAIVGLACRFGAAGDKAAFWEMLDLGQDVIRALPDGRWDASLADWTASPQDIALGGFLDDVRRFDHAFFGISKREADLMDPQQRLLMELGWHALEDAGIPPRSLAGSRTGVFVGLSSSEYAHLQLMAADNVTPFLGTGCSSSVAANRLSHFLDLRGPSFAVDAACSASLVALHLACESMRRGECEIALVGGVSLMLTPVLSVSMQLGGAASPTGRCRAFSSDADGIVRGEGAAVVVLKPVEAALRDADRIYAVVRGSAVGQDGKSNGLVAPSARAQEQLLRDAYAAAGVAPSAVEYVECHGTGTPLGDPIEADALARVIGVGRAADRALGIGSVKTNIGHTEAAAGIAGVIKTALAIYHGRIPRSLHFAAPNPRIDFAASGLRVCSEPASFCGDSERLAGVSAFGFGGTNAHAVLSAAPQAGRSAKPHAQLLHALPLWAHDPSALPMLAAAHATQLAESELDVGALCAAAARRRQSLPYRAAAVGGDAASLLEALRTLADGKTSSRACCGAAPAQRIAFVFSGYGELSRETVRELYEPFAPFRAALEACDDALQTLRGWSLMELIERPESARTMEHVQVRLLALQLAIVELLRDWGIAPSAVVGASVGEVAAACAAGALTLHEALSVVIERSCLMDAGLSRSLQAGAMLAVEAAPELVERLLEGFESEAGIAAQNSSHSVVLSGAREAIERIAARARSADVYVRLLSTPGAGHSPQMELLQPELVERLAGLRPSPARVALYSTVDPQLQPLTPDAAYWGRNLRETVRLAQAVDKMLDDGSDLFIEISPLPSVLPAIKRCIYERRSTARALSVVAPNSPVATSLSHVIAACHAAGAELSWDRIYPGAIAHVELPTYPFAGPECWLARDPSRSAQRRTAALDGEAQLVELAAQPGCWLWRRTLSVQSSPAIAEHRVEGMALVPTTFYISEVFAAASRLLSRRPNALRDLTIKRALFLRDDEEIELQIMLQRLGPNEAKLAIHSRRRDSTSSPWRLHGEGHIAHTSVPALEQLPAASDARPMSKERHYDRMRTWGVDYGPSFQLVTSLEVATAAAVGCVSAGDVHRAEMDPAWLDACLQVAAATVPAELDERARKELCLPTGVRRLWVNDATPRPAVSSARARASATVGTDYESDIEVRDGSGALLWAVEGLTVRSVPSPGARAGRDPESWLYALEWLPLAATEPPPASPSCWLLVGGPQDLRQAMCARLEQLGEPSRCLDARHCSEGAALVADGSEQIGHLRVLYLESLQPTAAGAGELDWLTQTLELMRALETSGLPADLWIVTSAAQAVVESDAPRPAQAALWGFGRALALERAKLWGGLLDLEPDLHPVQAAHAIVRTLSQAPQPEDQLAVRAGQVHVARLRRRERRADALAIPSFAADRTYLVTGGLGGLGLRVAAWLAAHGARQLLLVSRKGSSGLGEAQLRALSDLEHAGVRVRVAAADVSDARALTHAIEQAGSPPLAAIVHCAGVAAPRELGALDRAELAAVWSPKAQGAEVLLELANQRRLDWVVLFSSAAGVWGSRGLAHYAAANAYLDAIAQQFQTARGPALSVAWGMWGEVGMAADSEIARLGSLLGLRAMNPDAALQWLGEALDTGETTCTIADVDWGEFKSLFERGRGRRLLAELRAEEPKRTALRETNLSVKLRQLQPAASRALLLQTISELVAEALGVRVDAIRPETALETLGIDSLLALDLKNRLELELGVSVPASLLLSSSTLDELAQQTLSLLGQAHGALEVPPPMAANGPAQPVRNVLLTEPVSSLGAHVLLELLRKTDATVICLMACDSAREGKLRLRVALTALSAQEPPLRRVVVLPQECQHGLGLSEDRWSAVARRVDAIVHVADGNGHTRSAVEDVRKVARATAAAPVKRCLASAKPLVLSREEVGTLPGLQLFSAASSDVAEPAAFAAVAQQLVDALITSQPWSRTSDA